MGNRTEDHSEVLHDLKGEEEGYTPEGGGRCGENKVHVAAVEQPLLDEGANTVADKDCRVEL